MAYRRLVSLLTASLLAGCSTLDSVMPGSPNILLADIVGGHESPVGESPAGIVWQTQQSLFIPDLAEEHRWSKTTGCMREDGIQSCCFVPLTTAVRRLGAVGFGSLKKNAYSKDDVEFLQQVAKQVAVAVDNALHHEDLVHDRDQLRLLLEVSKSIASHRDLPGLFRDLAQLLHRVAQYDGIALVLHDPVKNLMRAHIIESPQSVGIPEGFELAPGEGPAGLVWKTQQLLVVPILAQETRFPKLIPAMREHGLQSLCAVPLTTAAKRLGAMVLASTRENAYGASDTEFLSQVAKQVAVAVENALAYQEIADLKDKLDKEKLYLEGEIQSEYNFEEIVGDSHALKQVLQQVEIVAPTDSSVLILGETGTGKELFARAIHNHSARQGRTFVKINCAAIPSGLLESELFGHEKGAFTGAIAQKVGRFELANGGTLFLDEVGDIPLELQSKLLRVLQEQEFERLGGTRTIRVDVRLVSATNRDLTQMVADKQFRSDLFYRLNVFPLAVPALRDRREDIPLLVRYFAQMFARRMTKQIETIPTDAMNALSRYHWPGNIRELENLIERAVILSQGSELRVPLGELKSTAAEAAPAVATLEAAEREHILRALQAAKWVIGGPVGAANRLGMKRTTLQSKMQKLGISRPQ